MHDVSTPPAGGRRCTDVPCGRATESRAHVVGECETYKEERDVLEEETRKIDEREMEEFGTLDSSQKNDRDPRKLTVATGGQTGGR